MSDGSRATRPVSSTPVSRTVRAVLTHPAARVLKRVLKDAWWTVKGRGIANPPLSQPVHSMLFVCLGNICRSPFAAHLAARRLAEAGRSDIRCASAGISTRQSGRAPAEAIDVAQADYGLSLQAHRPETLTPVLAGGFDLIVVMEAGQFEHVRRAHPELASRTVLLPLFDPAAVSAHQRFHIDDPFAQPRVAFEACYRRIDRSVTRLVAQVTAPDPTA